VAEEATVLAKTRKEEVSISDGSTTAALDQSRGDLIPTSRPLRPTPTSKPPGRTPPMTVQRPPNTTQTEKPKNSTCSSSYYNRLLITGWDRIRVLLKDGL